MAFLADGSWLISRTRNNIGGGLLGIRQCNLKPTPWAARGRGRDWQNWEEMWNDLSHPCGKDQSGIACSTIQNYAPFRRSQDNRDDCSGRDVAFEKLGKGQHLDVSWEFLQAKKGKRAGRSLVPQTTSRTERRSRNKMCGWREQQPARNQPSTT